MGRLITVVCLLMLAAPLAGCISSGPSEDEATYRGGTSTIESRAGTVDAPESDDEGPTHGSLLGTVLSPEGLPLKDARVSIVRTELFMKTDDQGNFTFAVVEPGAQTLRVERMGYRVFEQALVIKAGETLAIEVVMSFEEGVGSAEADHIHDYWAGAESVVVMDRYVSLSGSPTEISGTTAGVPRMVTAANLDGIGFYEWEFYLPEKADHPSPGYPGAPALVYPGTERIEITMSWTPNDMGVSTIRVSHDPPNGDKQWSDHAPTGTIHEVIVEDPRNTDRGHSVQSRWRFGFRAENNPGQGPGYEPALASGQMHVKIEVFGGFAPLEPPHPKPWANGNCITLRTPDDTGSPPNPAGVVPSHRSSRPGTLSLGSEGTVAPGATRLTVEFQWQTERNGALDDSPLDDWSLKFSTADQDYRSVPWSELREPRLVSEDLAAQTKVYEIDIEDNSWLDPWYDTRSSWRLWPYDDTVSGDPGDEYILPDWFALQYNFYLNVVVCNANA